MLASVRGLRSNCRVPDAGTVTQISLRAQLRELVASKSVGARLPSERELSEQWNVARMTLRRAVDSLIAEGLVERRHGSGTYVTPQPFVRLLGLTSFTRDMHDRGLVPSSRLLAFTTAPANVSLAKQLHVPVGDLVLTFTRLRYASGDAMAVETVSIPQRLVPGIVGSDLSGSLYELLADRYHIVPGAARVTIEPTRADPRMQELLSITRNQPCLRMQLVDSDTRGRVIMVADCVYRGDRYQLTAEISGAAFTAPQSRRVG